MNQQFSFKVIIVTENAIKDPIYYDEAAKIIIDSDQYFLKVDNILFPFVYG